MQLIRYIRELYDIWTYRLQLNGDIKHNICPRGSPFRNINLYNILNYDVFFLKKVTLNIIDELINTGIDAEYKSLGAIYVLTALTLVSNDAAAAMPWTIPLGSTIIYIYSSINYLKTYHMNGVCLLRRSKPNPPNLKPPPPNLHRKPRKSLLLLPLPFLFLLCRSQE